MTAVLHDLSHRPRYGLDAGESSALLDLVRAHLGGTAEVSSGAVCIAVDGTDPIANLGRALERIHAGIEREGRTLREALENWGNARRRLSLQSPETAA